ncbi:MAG: hypothetical protein LIO71_00005 [Ruminococcus sp.]|nr:hypothetical protein [Ruminococcus sp.]
MNIITKEELLNLIINVNFDEAYTLFSKLDFNTQKNYLEEISIETNSILPYGFVCYILTFNNTPKIHDLAIGILLVTCWIDGTYQLIIHHIYEALKLEPTCGRKEFLLFFNQTNGPFINKKEEIKLALEILEENKNSDIAKKILQK